MINQIDPKESPEYKTRRNFFIFSIILVTISAIAVIATMFKVSHDVVHVITDNIATSILGIATSALVVGAFFVLCSRADYVKTEVEARNITSSRQSIPVIIITDPEESSSRVVENSMIDKKPSNLPNLENLTVAEIHAEEEQSNNNEPEKSISSSNANEAKQSIANEAEQSTSSNYNPFEGNFMQHLKAGSPISKFMMSKSQEATPRNEYIAIEKRGKSILPQGAALILSDDEKETSFSIPCTTNTITTYQEYSNPCFEGDQINR